MSVLAIVLALFMIRRLTKPNPAKQLDAIHSHQSHHFEDFRLSANDFYADLTTIIQDREFPKVSAKVVTLTDGGLFDAQRAYLQVASQDHVFYVCAAPFGKNFFISYWLRPADEEFADMFLRKVFGVLPTRSFFRVDSEAMFVESMKKAVMKAIANATEQRGLRQPTASELIPTTLS